jgi:hypothetical protein
VLQHCSAPVVAEHALPCEMHAAAAHLPASQRLLQQSVGEEHEAPVCVHVPSDEAQR